MKAEPTCRVPPQDSVPVCPEGVERGDRRLMGGRWTDRSGERGPGVDVVEAAVALRRDGKNLCSIGRGPERASQTGRRLRRHRQWARISFEMGEGAQGLPGMRGLVGKRGWWLGICGVVLVKIGDPKTVAGARSITGAVRICNGGGGELRRN